MPSSQCLQHLDCDCESGSDSVTLLLLSLVHLPCLQSFSGSNGSCSPELFREGSGFAVLPPGRAMLHIMKILEPELRQGLETAVS
jgi:hypothetical protein